MSFTQNTTGRGYAPGWLLAEEVCSRETAQINANHSQVVTLADGTKIVPMGAVIPSNDGNAKGILYEDVEVTTGNMPGSIVTKGAIYEGRLPASVESSAKAVLTGITFKTEPSVIRPDFSIDSLTALTVQSAAGPASGDTKLTVTGYTLQTGESWKYKVTDTTAATVLPGEVVGTGWTAWNGTADITAATDKKLALVAVNAAGQAVAYGTATVTAKA